MAEPSMQLENYKTGQRKCLITSETYKDISPQTQEFQYPLRINTKEKLNRKHKCMITKYEDKLFNPLKEKGTVSQVNGAKNKH